MAKFNSAEYTRLRDIAQKRQKRLSAAGFAAPIHIPTIREIKAGTVSPGLAMQELKNYLSGGSTVKAARQTGLVPDFLKFPELPKPKPISEAEKVQRKKEQQHRYRQRKRIREKLSPEKQNRYNAYLKALETISKAWKAKGRNIGIDLQSMSPAEAQAFVEYLDFRFSQGDFSQHYVIDEFIQDFSKMKSKGYKMNQITADFNKFLEDRAALQNRSEAMEGINQNQFFSLWGQFVGD